MVIFIVNYHKGVLEFYQGAVADIGHHIFAGPAEFVMMLVEVGLAVRQCPQYFVAAVIDQGGRIIAVTDQRFIGGDQGAYSPG